MQTLLQTPGAKLPDVAKGYGIPEGTLRGWYDEDRRQKAGEGGGASGAGATEGDAAVAAATAMEQMLVATAGGGGGGSGSGSGDLGPHDSHLDPAGFRDPPVAARDGDGPGPGGNADAVDDDAAMNPDDDDDAAPQSSSSKKRRQRYSNETKIQVILALETRPNARLNEVAKEFGVASGTVRGWREEADKIQKQAMENRRVGAKANPSKDPLKRIWDAILTLFELNSRLPPHQRLDVNVAVVRTIGMQARDVLLEEYGRRGGDGGGGGAKMLLTPTELGNMDKFKASETWARKWARDHQVISSKPVANPAEAAQDRFAELQHIVAQYPPEHVYTMTSTSLFYRILPHRVYVAQQEATADTAADADGAGEAKAHSVRACKGLKSKDRLTLYVCTNETGGDKLPVTCIGKYENPACFQVTAQRILPYLSQKQALSDAGTFQRWWRSYFLPHVRTMYPPDGDESQRILLLVESVGPCKAELLKDPTGQVRVEGLPTSPNKVHGMLNTVGKGDDGVGGSDFQHHASASRSAKEDNPSSTRNAFPACQPLDFGILETIKRRYRYRLLQEVMEAFDERDQRRKVADEAGFSAPSRGLREGGLANLCDAMRLLECIWQEVASTTIIRSWQRTKMRLKNVLPPELEPKPGTRAKSEKRQTTREKKQLVKDLSTFLSRHESRDVAVYPGSNQLEEMLEKLKNCFLYTDGAVIEKNDMFDSLEEWIQLEDSPMLSNLFMEEIKEEMNIQYLVGLKEPVERAVPEADEPEDPELDKEKIEKNNNSKDVELDLETAMELAGTIKSTAVKLFESGNTSKLGQLAVQLDEAADSVFRLLREQKKAAALKIDSDKAKADKKRTDPADRTGLTTDENPDPDPADVAAVPASDDNDIGGVDLSDLGDYSPV